MSIIFESALGEVSRWGHVTFSFSCQEGGVVALFKVCRQDSFRCLYPQALRTLASICCVEEGVHQLEKVSRHLAGGGPEVPESGV